jgi:predicted lipoprotein with Yx(FWY)xxD motif
MRRNPGMNLGARGVFTAMTLRTASALAALTATLLVAGCGGSDDPETAASSAPTVAPAYDYGTTRSQATPEAAAGESATVKAVTGALGTMLTDAEGRTLYLWEADRSSQSACDGACADAWPPVTTIGEPKAGEGADAALLGTAKRADGTLAVTYDGHPLYYFAGDSAAGDANGQGSDGFGAKWWVVSPAGDAIEA